jgi:hypothetical protein
MLKQRLHLTVAIRQCDPELHAVQATAVLRRGPLRVGNGGTRGHHVDAAWPKQRFVFAVSRREVGQRNALHPLCS